ncbi:dUTP diphosphatase [Candidatus Woesearchaeota archaeon]|nr:dUTP diphosphatase [Candidatus Woesearchaeota archaeon]
MEISIQKIVDVKTPSYAHEDDAGLDFYSAEDYILKPMEERPISTGVKIAIPQGYVGLVWDRSGLASNNSLHVMGGVVDSTYRGEVCIILKNLGKDDFEIKKDMKIAQLLIQPVVAAKIKEAGNLDDTARGERGFGSTGI